MTLALYVVCTRMQISFQYLDGYVCCVHNEQQVAGKEILCLE